MNLLKKYSEELLPLVERYSSFINTESYFYKPSFVHLWAIHDDTHLFEGEYGLYIYLRASGSFLMPYAEDIPKAIEELKAIAKEEDIPLSIRSIPSDFLHLFDDTEFELERDRNLDEYVYLQEKLIGLAGRHLQSKRNHIAQFTKSYPSYSLEPLGYENRDEVLAMTREWIGKMPEESKKALNDEYITIERAFDKWTHFAFSGAMLRVDSKLIAYTIGEKHGDEVVVHYEKANTDFHGAYPMINREYQLNYAPKTTFVNRMEDAGVEGLRRAKESYKPVKMIEKWSARLR